jgi:hypothetical protein
MPSAAISQEEKVEAPVETGSRLDEHTQTDSVAGPVGVQPITSNVPYSVFGSTEKKMIVLTASIASFFSPLSSNIYLPALNTIARDLHVSNSQINLSITTYLVSSLLEIHRGSGSY